MKKLLSIVLCLVLILSFGINASAKGSKKGHFDGMSSATPNNNQEEADGVSGATPNNNQEDVDGTSGATSKGRGPGGFNGQMPEGGFDGQFPEGGFDGQLPEGGTDGQMPQWMTPPQGDGSEPPQMPDGQTLPEMPEGMTPPQGENGEPPQMPGGAMSTAPTEYAAANTYAEDTDISNEEIASAEADENAVLVTGGTTTITDSTVTRNNSASTGGDSSSFYGVGAAVLTTGGTVNVENSKITTNAQGGAGVFAYNKGTAYVTNTVIETNQNTSGGIHVAGGGTLYANNLTVTTKGESSAAIRSDRGGGTMKVDGGTYTSYGSGSPSVYVTADITVSNATLTAEGSEALCLEGKNSVTLNNCTLSGNMPDLEVNDNTWTVILYQSMSGDSEVGKGTFTMNGGTINSLNGGVFYTTNTVSEFTLENVTVNAQDDSEYLLRCTGNTNSRGWGQQGSNGAQCVFNAINQQLNGNIIYDSISELTVNLDKGSVFTGTVIKEENAAGNGMGSCAVNISEDSAWIVTGNSTVSSVNILGTVQDDEGNAVSVVYEDGTVIANGTSQYTITVVNNHEV